MGLRLLALSAGASGGMGAAGAQAMNAGDRFIIYFLVVFVVVYVVITTVQC